MCRPRSISIREYSDQLWVKDCRFENVAGAAVIISNEQSPLNEIGFENAVLRKTCRPSRCSARAARRSPARAPSTGSRSFNYGLIVPGLGTMGDHRHALRRGAAGQPASAAATGDPAAAAHGGMGQRAHARRRWATARPTTPPPSRRPSTRTGCCIFRADTTSSATRYARSRDTVLIGLHPLMTRIDLPDGTAGFQGVGAPRP